MNAYIAAMRRYFDFKGRASRTEFWMFTLVVFIGGIVALILDAALGNGQNGPPFVTALWIIPHGRYLPSRDETMRYNSTSTTAALIAAALLLVPGTSEADDRFVHICKMNINQIFGAKVSEYYPPEFSIVSEVHPDTGLWFLNDRPMIIDRQDTKDETRRAYFVSFSKFLPALSRSQVLLQS
ncbi:DUF805 domain-containing protein [Shinella sp.]|uniref:DUF805 domain-containing protein n=1 Tax=Shinella sp. TaxID=1870904 RepID=UPI0028B090FA|nr:DUF805 domain-containing protein [Shinella sp.]